MIPTYEEVGNIGELIPQVLAQSQLIDVLVVDDGSKDGTPERVKAAAQQFPNRVFLEERSGKLGLASAYVHGLTWGIKKDYHWLVEMDADFSHDPQVLKTMQSLFHSADVVIGSRYVAGGGTKNWNFFRRMISLGGSLYARVILGVPIFDFTGGFNAWRRDVLEAIKLKDIRSEGYSFQIELKAKAHALGYKLIETPILFCERRAGKSKMSGRIVFEAIFRVVSIRRVLKGHSQ